MKSIIPTGEFVIPAFQSWSNWFLLVAGNWAAGGFNAMTISWGSFGIVWGKPFAQVFVRPQRHTRQFMDSGDSFTICGFSSEYAKALEILGSKSGRDGDKLREAGLVAEPSTAVNAPSIAEASLIIECRKMYFQDLDPANFRAEHIAPNYGKKDYHRQYFGEILLIRGDEAHRLSTPPTLPPKPIY